MISALASSVLVSLPSPENSSASDKWTFLGAVVTFVIAPIVVYLVSNRALKPPTPTTPPAPASTGRNTFSVEGMSANTVEVMLSMWRKIEELEETQESWSREREEFIQINEELRRHNRALAEGFDEVIDWIDRGAVPPPPSVAQHVRDLVQRAIETGAYGSLTDREGPVAH